jgi:transmembrane sensor
MSVDRRSDEQHGSPHGVGDEGGRIGRALRAEASAWVAKLHGPERSPDLEEDFRAWLGANPDHARAFEHITEIWDALGSVNVGGLPRLASNETLEARSRTEYVKPRARVLHAFAAVLLLAAAGVGSWLYITHKAPRLYLTGIGEERIVTLDDGSRVYLNSDTRLDVDLEKHARKIELQGGEAYFEVTRDPGRPFTVTAGDHTVTALGTSFVVRYDPERTAVTLLEGKVAVAGSSASSNDGQPPANPSGSAERRGSGILLAPGQRITFEQGGTSAIDTPRPETTAAWRRGEVVFDNTPLKTAIAEMSRYQRQHLVLDDVSTGELPISGIYQTGKSQDFAQAVAAIYDLEVETDGNDLHLRRKR